MVLYDMRGSSVGALAAATVAVEEASKGAGAASEGRNTAARVATGRMADAMLGQLDLLRGGTSWLGPGRRLL